MKRKFLAGLATTLLLLGMVGFANATPVTFFGEGLTDADDAQAAFMASLTDVGTEDFEAPLPLDASDVELDFTGAGTATLTGSGYVSNQSNGYRATSGTQYWFAETGDFSIEFTDAVSAFGFYGTDIGDYGGSLSLEYEYADGTTNTLSVRDTVNRSIDGEVLYFGFYEDEADKAFTSISFINDSTGSNLADKFGFDDMTIGTYEQIAIGVLPEPVDPGPVPEPLTPGAVPEPSSILLMAAGLLGFAGCSRKRS